ncbi:MAG TPA: alpha-galactosidase, partial [Solirubrobacteraceae bacterium]|nr:alpha-galactosidase [Solirubrobacteraceae bacterium]
MAHPDGWTAFEWPRTGAGPHELVALRLAHSFAGGEAYMREGWQSWSTPVPARVGTGVRRAASAGPPRFGRRHWLLAPPYAGDESYHVWRSASATAYVERSSAVFVADAEGLAVVREEPAGGRHPVVWFAPRPAGDAELAARLTVARPPVLAYTGWSTWDAYGTDLRADDLLEELGAIERRLGDTVEVVDVDDGWQRVIGDWVPRDRAMAHALGAVAGDRRLALWWAPFVVHREAELAAEHPDWIVRDRDGHPVVVLARDEPWEAWALDLTRPEVVAWLGDTAARL